MKAMDNSAEKSSDIPAVMAEIGAQARAAARILAKASTEAKNAALTAAAESISANAVAIKIANAKDMAAAREKKLSAALLDRLELNDSRIAAMAKGLLDIAGLHD